MEILPAILLGYFIGSIPFAYVIGKVFYRTDVRQHGSGNLGGSNTGRVLGRQAGLAVMMLDLLKATLVVWLSGQLFVHPWVVACGGLAAAVGHCYPVFAGFRGGKAVAVFYGFLFGLWTCMGYGPLVFFLPLATFLLVLFLFKIVALASMVSAFAAVLYMAAAGVHVPILVAAAAFTLLVVIRHKENIVRILHGTENRIRWM